MNIQLYNALNQARDFLITVKKNEDDIVRRKELIKRAPIDYKPTSIYFKTNPYKHKDFSWGTFFLLFFVCAPVLCPIYILYLYFCNRKYRKAMREQQRAIDNWENSTEGMKLAQEIQESIEKQQKELDEIIAKYQKYYSDNYYKCLGFLPDWARTFKKVDDISNRINYIDGLIRYVKRGAETLDDAMGYYAEELREEWAREEYLESQEHLEELQKESIEALNAIAKNQERTNDELDRIYRERFVNRR